MTVLDAFAAPRGRAVAQCVVDGVECVVDEEVHLLFRTCVARAALTAQSHVADEHAFGTDVLAELQEFVVAEAHRGTIAPSVVNTRTGGRIADGFLPFDTVRKGDALHHAAARPADECRTHGFERLGDILAQSVFAVAERLGREERNVIEQQRSLAFEFDDEAGVVVSAGSYEFARILTPRFVRVEGQRPVAEFRVVGADEFDGGFAVEPVAVRGVETQEIAFVLFDVDAPESGIGERDASLNGKRDLQRRRSRAVERIFGRELHGCAFACQLFERPCGYFVRCPAKCQIGMGLRAGKVIADGGRIDFIADPVAFGYGAVFESAVLNQLGVESAVARVVDLFEEDAVQG